MSNGVLVLVVGPGPGTRRLGGAFEVQCSHQGPRDSAGRRRGHPEGVLLLVVHDISLFLHLLEDVGCILELLLNAVTTSASESPIVNAGTLIDFLYLIINGHTTSSCSIVIIRMSELDSDRSSHISG